MTLPDTMRAVLLTGHGGMDKLEYRTDVPLPQRTDDEVLIQVQACGMNNTDVNTRTGWYSKSVTEATNSTSQTTDDEDPSWGGAAIQFPRIQGGDPCGIIVDANDKNLIGKRVIVDTVLRDWNDPLNLEKCGYLGSECDGGFADYLCVDYRNVHPVECGLSDAELSTFAISYSTAENMLSRAAVKAGDTVLIPGASGGVGSALVQLAKRRGATTIAMASESKHAMLQDTLAPDVLLPRQVDDLEEVLHKTIGTKTVSVVADVVGGDQFMPLLEVIERGGRYTCSGAIAGPVVNFDLRTFYLNDITMTGATLLAPNIFPDLVGYIERGEIKPILAASYPLEQFKQAQQAFIDKQHVGNIAVTMS